MTSKIRERKRLTLKTYNYQPNSDIRRGTYSPYESFTKRGVQPWVDFRLRVSRLKRKRSDLPDWPKRTPTEVYKLLESATSFMGNDLTDYCPPEDKEKINKHCITTVEDFITNAPPKRRPKSLRFCNLTMGHSDWNTYFHHCPSYRRDVQSGKRYLQTREEAGKATLEEGIATINLLSRKFLEIEHLQEHDINRFMAELGSSSAGPDVAGVDEPAGPVETGTDVPAGPEVAGPGDAGVDEPARPEVAGGDEPAGPEDVGVDEPAGLEVAGGDEVAGPQQTQVKDN